MRDYRGMAFSQGSGFPSCSTHAAFHPSQSVNRQNVFSKFVEDALIPNSDIAKSRTDQMDSLGLASNSRLDQTHVDICRHPSDE